MFSALFLYAAKLVNFDRLRLHLRARAESNKHRERVKPYYTARFNRVSHSLYLHHFHCLPVYFAVVCTDQEPGTVYTDSNQVKFIVIIKIANEDFKDSASRSKGYLRCPLLSRKSRYIGF